LTDRRPNGELVFDERRDERAVAFRSRDHFILVTDAADQSFAADWKKRRPAELARDELGECFREDGDPFDDVRRVSTAFGQRLSPPRSHI
jgi:hypothetical protein